ncbi:MAG: hypothetical protein JW829_09460 [Pirellulales bacterium]|nr:hypothetical protein [Pirellulales bacterium]
MPVATRIPLKFGAETLRHVHCLRVCLAIRDAAGRLAEGWGETPLSVQWAWPSSAAYEDRLESMTDCCKRLAHAWPAYGAAGHPIELGHDFLRDILPGLAAGIPTGRIGGPMPYLASLVCASAFDIALHDAYGNLHGIDVYKTYNAQFMNRDLAEFLEPASDTDVSFAGRWPAEFLVDKPPRRLPAWHLVGGLDLLFEEEKTGSEPADGYPVLLRDWITADGLTCLKIKLRGNDAAWDFARLVDVGTIAVAMGVESLSADFNCCVQDVAYVNDILDRLRANWPAIDDRLLYVEQPFAYELEENRLDVHSVSARKPLFLDESAHDWLQIRLGRELGWTGVALKTCKTQTGAILSLCWAKAHQMPMMVQDLTNPMLAQIPHVRLAAMAGTIRGVETNAMQFYPDASAPEAVIHPGLYVRRHGEVDLSTLAGPGFGYRLKEIDRVLPEPVACHFAQ